MGWKTINGRRYYYARFLSSLLTLARVRKLAVPNLQVNIARNQVNVAETRP